MTREAGKVLWLPPRPGWDTVTQALRRAGLAPDPPPAFVARPADAGRVLMALGRARPRVVVVEGPVGIGKSALARRIASRVEPLFPGGVLWVEGDLADPRPVQERIALALGFDRDLPEPDDGRDWQQGFTTHFWSRRRLLVLDDVTRVEQVAAFAHAEQGTAVIVTTRFRHIAEALGCEAVSLGPLRDEVLARLVDAEVGSRIADMGLGPIVAGNPGRLLALAQLVGQTCSPGIDAALRRAATSSLLGLRAQLSPPACALWDTLARIAPGPTPLADLRDATRMPLATVRWCGSELIDAHVASAVGAATDREPSLELDPWARLSAPVAPPGSA